MMDKRRDAECVWCDTEFKAAKYALKLSIQKFGAVLCGSCQLDSRARREARYK